MKITICIGSSCHIKGSRQVVEQLQSLVEEASLHEKVELAGTFCLGNCMNGVSVKIDDDLFSLKPESTKEFFETQVRSRI